MLFSRSYSCFSAYTSSLSNCFSNTSSSSINLFSNSNVKIVLLHFVIYFLLIRILLITNATLSSTFSIKNLSLLGFYQQHATLEKYSTVQRHTTKTINSHASTIETLFKKLLIKTFVIHTEFKPGKFSNKFKPLRIEPVKFINHLSDVTYGTYGTRWHFISHLS